MKAAHHAALAELFGPLPFQRQLADALVVVRPATHPVGYAGPVTLPELTIQLSPWHWLARTTRATPATRRLTRLIAEALATDTWNIPFPDDDNKFAHLTYHALHQAASLRRFAQPETGFIRMVMDGDEESAYPLQQWDNQESACLLPPDVPLHLVRLGSAHDYLLLMLGANVCPGGGPIVVLQERKPRIKRAPHWQNPTFDGAFTVYLVDDTTGEWAAIAAEPEWTTEPDSEEEGAPTGRLRPVAADGNDAPAWLNHLHYIGGYLIRYDTGARLRWAVHPRQVRTLIMPPLRAYSCSEWLAADRATPAVQLGDAGADHPLLAGRESLAYLSAADPAYGPNAWPSGAENRARTQQLRERLTQRGLTWTDAVGRAQDGQFPEAGLLIFDASIEQLIALAREFEQAAFMYLPRADVATLWHCPPDAPAHAITMAA